MTAASSHSKKGLAVTDKELCERLRDMLPKSPFAPTENFPPYQAADRIAALSAEVEKLNIAGEYLKELAATTSVENDRLREALKEIEAGALPITTAKLALGTFPSPVLDDEQ